MKRSIRQFSIGLAAILACTIGAQAFAQSMSSTNYKIPFDAFSEGGARSTSTNFRAEDTVSENSSPTGENLSSTNFLACVGYQCLQEAPFLTVTFAVQSSPCTSTSSSSPPYAVPLGTLTSAAVSTGSNRVCIRAASNAVGGLIVSGRSVNGALKSISTPTDTIPSVTATLAAGTSGYGYCSSQAVNGFTAQSPFSGSCDTGSNHAVGAISTSNQTIWSASGPVNGYGELLTKAAISGVVPAHNDYSDTLMVTVTATY